jgi:hypothetical protein
LKDPGLFPRSQRLFVGENENREGGLFLDDARGKPGLRINNNKQNLPVIETLDENSEVTVSK